MLAEIGAANVPELVVINKIDDADPVAIKALQLRERESVLVSARTGEGWTSSAPRSRTRLPERDQLVRVSVPYGRGDLVARAHAAGEVAHEEHGPDGTLLEARVPPELAVRAGAVRRRLNARSAGDRTARAAPIGRPAPCTRR